MGAQEQRRLDAYGWLDRTTITLDPGAERGWKAAGEAPPHVLAQMLDLYAPLRTKQEPFVLAHLGQSVDGFIAGADRRSVSLNDPCNIVHLHRLRALFDVVLVGGATVCADDPKLTTRLVPGDNPVRVVIDWGLRCEPSHGLFNDGLAPTLLVAASDAPSRAYPISTRVLRVKSDRSQARLTDALQLLEAEGLDRVFIEGGGRTVSRALTEGALSRLHVAVAPLIIGDGVPGVRLNQLARFADALRPPCRTFAMGADVLFDFDLGALAPASLRAHP